ncbi:MAG: AIR synthase-related protein, partial [Promethearchaeota archaeon]
FIEKSPYGAGFSAIYVGIDDIIACGGTPLASTITIAYNDEKTGKETFAGVLDATKVFKTPLIRGHTTTDSPSLAISSTIIGTIKVDHFLSAGGSHSGDFLAVVWDPEGKTSHANKNYWNTITMKTSEEFYHKRSFITPAIENKYITACKDISNGGILGTLFQMMQYAKLGAEIDLKILESHITSDNLQFSTEEFIFLFLTSGFLISGKDETKDEFIDLVQKANMNFYEIGKIHGNDQIRLKYGNEEEILLEGYI